MLEKYKNMPIQAKASIWYTICNILQKGISFVTIPIYTRVLTTSEYGQYSVFQSWCNILIIFATLNLYCGVFTKAMIDYDDDKERYISSMQGLSSVITIGMFLIYAIAHSFWNSVFEMGTVTMVLMFLYFVFFPALQFWSVRQRVENKYGKMVAVTMLVSVLTPVVSLILLFYSDLRANAIIWGTLLVQIVVGAFFYIYQFWKGKTFYVKEYWVHGLRFNIPLIPHYLSLIVLAQSDRIMIQNFCGDDKAGIYNLAYQVSMVMNIFVGAINNSFVPWIYQNLKTREYNRIKKTSNALCALIAGMSLCIILIAPEIVMILGTKEYYEAIWVIPPVAISVYFSFVYGLFSSLAFYYNTTGYVMVASSVGAVLNIILNFIFIPKFGFIAAAYTTLFCYFVFMLMHFYFMVKVCKQHTNGDLIYDNRLLFLTCFGIFLFSVACSVIYGHTAVRYCLCLIILAVAFINRRRIKRLLAKKEE